MYPIYKAFIENSDNKQAVIDAIRSEEARCKCQFYTEQIVWKRLIDKFAEHVLNPMDQTYALDDCILKGFPLSEQLKLLQPWVDDPYFWCWDSIMYEMMKMCFHI